MLFESIASSSQSERFNRKWYKRIDIPRIINTIEALRKLKLSIILLNRSRGATVDLNGFLYKKYLFRLI